MRLAGHISAALEQSATAISVCDFDFAPYFANGAARSLFGDSHARLKIALHGRKLGTGEGWTCSAMREIIQRDGFWREAMIVLPETGNSPLQVDVEISLFEVPDATGLMVIARMAENRAAATQLRASEIVKISPRLSAREKEVVLGLMDGCSNKEIALRMGISPRTVEFHRGRLMARFQARSLVCMLQVILADGN